MKPGEASQSLPLSTWAAPPAGLLGSRPTPRLPGPPPFLSRGCVNSVPLPLAWVPATHQLSCPRALEEAGGVR